MLWMGIPVCAEPEGSGMVDAARLRARGERASSTYRYRDPETRRAYMRELMRRRRG